MKIGIGITTTTGRNETAAHAISQICEFSEGCKIVVVKDVPGIAKAKNQCLAQLDDCENIFLYDDDVWPITDIWLLPYINSGINHLSFTFDKLHHGGTNGNRKLIKSENGLNIYQNPNGCMIYLNRKCLDIIGGFDERFIGWGYDHVNLSQRIYNAGLTPYPFMDVAGSLELFHSMDYFCEIKSSVEPLQRAGFIQHNRPIYLAEAGSKEFMKYK